MKDHWLTFFFFPLFLSLFSQTIGTGQSTMKELKWPIQNQSPPLCWTKWNGKKKWSPMYTASTKYTWKNCWNKVLRCGKMPWPRTMWTNWFMGLLCPGQCLVSITMPRPLRCHRRPRPRQTPHHDSECCANVPRHKCGPVPNERSMVWSRKVVTA